jgi:hypothetical protein
MEGAEERDDVRALRGIPGEFDRRLDRLRSGVAEVGARGPVDRGDLGQTLANLGIDRQVEIRRREMDQLRGLLLDRGDDLRVTVTGRVDRDARREVEEEIAVDVLDREALPADRHDRVGTRQARRRPRLVERDVLPRLGTW